MTMSPRLFGALAVLVALGALAAIPGMALAAPKLYVANDGVDDPSCGAKKSPCRSITQAIALASDGTTIIVGPGRYGPRHEVCAEAVCDDCLLDVSRRVAIISRDGAGATILDAAGERTVGVELTADGVVFGRRKKGFTVIGAGIGIAFRCDDVRVEGNWVVRNTAVTQGGGILADGASAATIVGNVVSDNDSFGIHVDDGGNHVVADNRVGGHRGVGIHTTAQTSSRIAGNAVGAENVGMLLQGRHEVVRNVIVASADIGLVLDHGSSHVACYQVEDNLIAGSRGQGIHVQEGEPSLTVAATKNTLVGNGLRVTPNCGILVEQDVAPGAVALAKNFWGVPTGPGPTEPADDLCGAATFGSPAKRERRTRLKSAQ